MEKKTALLEALNIIRPEAELILDKYNIKYQVFLETISKPEYNLKELGKSATRIADLLAELLPARKLDGFLNKKPCTYILYKVGMKMCVRCNQALFLGSFRLNKAQKLGYNTYCEACHLETNKPTDASRQARYKSNKLQRTPKWSEHTEISEFYRLCPAGYHVDHIIPLNGEKVSGLHVLGNLQYLTAEENCKKHNTYAI